ncbi:hypothetical protein DNTS_003310 [Danionella cerebrum]|uniref:PH domain-containing protein n=1 Tax=Danionella cerebrum TaxID=2873325 RepID=A0A553MVN5_9TELE|nr:hypothetical protein DNTS_003310 [Danionella translucida]
MPGAGLVLTLTLLMQFLRSRCECESWRGQWVLYAGPGPEENAAEGREETHALLVDEVLGRSLGIHALLLQNQSPESHRQKTCKRSINLRPVIHQAIPVSVDYCPFSLQFQSRLCKRLCVLGWMVILPDRPDQPNIFQLNHPDRGNVYKFETSDRFSAILWHKHLEEACKRTAAQVEKKLSVFSKSRFHSAIPANLMSFE